MTITKETQVHAGFEEFEKAKKKNPEFSMKQMFGKWQYIYTKEMKQVISMIELPDYYRDGIDWWEIYAREGSLIDDVERFLTKEEAEKRIEELFGEKIE